LGREISVDRLIGKYFRSVNRWFHDADLGSANHPFVISDTSETSILSLSYLLKPDVQLQLFSPEKFPQMANRSTDRTLFVFDGSDGWLNYLQTE